MNALRSPPEYKVTLACTAESLCQVTVLHLTDIKQFNLFFIATNCAIYFLKNGQEIVDKSASCSKDILCGFDELFVENLEQREVRLLLPFELFEKCVSLFEDGIILSQVLEIAFVLLRNNGIQETTPFVTSFFDELIVLRADHYQGNKTDVVNEAFIVFFSASEGFFHTTFDAARKRFFSISSLHHRHFFSMRNILTIRR